MLRYQLFHSSFSHTITLIVNWFGGSGGGGGIVGAPLNET